MDGGPSLNKQGPMVAMASVCAIKYAGGVMMASDTLGSWGSLARFRAIDRLYKITDKAVIGASGDYSDFQFACELFRELMDEERVLEDGAQRSPAELHSYLARVLYNRRTRGNPLWNSFVIIGREAGESFLGVADLQGTAYKCDFTATGMGGYLALPMLRDGWHADISRDDAKKLLEDAMRVLLYRDCRTINRIQLAEVDDDGARVSEPYELSQQWELRAFIDVDMGRDERAAAVEEEGGAA